MPRPFKPKPPTADEQHAEWLGLLRAEGPFLALPVLSRAFPQGLDTVPQEVRARIRQAWAERCEAPDVLTPGWQDLVLGELLRYHSATMSPPAGAQGLQPDALISGPGGAIRMHLYRRGAHEPLTTSVHGRPALSEQAAQVCRESGIALALLTNGQFWVLVHARPNEATSTAAFDADLWLEEPVLLRAFATLCSSGRVLPPPTLPDGRPSTSTAGLFAASAAEHTHVTNTLGQQVRQAVELFVAELARLDRESDGRRLAWVSERDLYRGALTTLMRLVFLLFAEEQRLLPVTDPVYDDGYAVSTLFDQLEAERSVHGDEVGDRRCSAWPRLLALFKAIHGGSEHPRFRIPAYGGSLFDPKAFPWLADAAVTDRVVRTMLDALLMLRHKGKAAERLSYARLGVEEIGHVYEGLLEFSCLRVSEPYVGLIGKTEPEVALAELEAVPDGERADWLREQCGLTERQVTKALAAQPSPHQLGELHAACDNDDELAEKVRPFWGLLRIDLRGQPTVFPAGSVLFTQLGQRRSTGTHYTPRALAEEVVEHTLAPLCYSPGPAEGAERKAWRTRSADELLALKVVDPAMGSGAFLVSACRYLADRMLEAWDRDGVPSRVARSLGADDGREGLLLEARRLVASRCVYGVDRDDMATELAKLSLWLVTLAKNKPFGFLDHALRCGDSLVGLVSERQVTAFHLDPLRGRDIGATLLSSLNDEIAGVLSDAVEQRDKIEATVVQDAHDAAEKAKLLEAAEKMTEKLRLAADVVVGAALSTAAQDPDDDDAVDLDTRLIGVSGDMEAFLRRKNGESRAEGQLRNLIDSWLRGARPQPVRPFHWPLEFPEVMRRGGFDAVIGNPPFIGGKRVSGAVGKDMREYLKTHIAGGKPGNADLCSYFLLRNLDVSHRGRVGIIATNTIAQGDTREVGLDQVIGEKGWSVYRAEKSQPWPGTASLEVSLLWVGNVDGTESRYLDGRVVKGITPSLEPQSRVSGNPHRLVANEDMSFQGAIILGLGFTMPPEQAQELISKDPRNKEVLFPYLNGDDLNSDPGSRASRWVIDFNDWSIEMAMSYPDVFSIVEQQVKPQRQRTKPDGSYVLRKPLPQRWWQYADKRPALRRAIAELDRVLVIALVSKTGLPVWAPTGQVFSHMLGVFAVDRDAYLTLLSSSMHFVWWTTKGESTLETRLRYTPSDGFETFPQPVLTARMDQAGEQLHSFRRSVMRERNLGLTKLYNLVHDASVTDEDVRRLREIHTEVDYATAEAYGWDLELGHDHHPTRQGERFIIAPDVRVEVLDRLLELNHERYVEELAKGLHGKKKRKAKRVKSTSAKHLEDALFPPPDALF
ncbi:Eco57I restriction-modification methylase domain-containing protein [Saccharopolyspora sp. NPDC000995]